MNTTLWIVQVFVALVFLGAGLLKVTQPKAKLVTTLGWVENFSQPAVHMIGALEVLGGIGLLAPAVTGILPWLTPVAAAGLALTMVGAIVTHLRRQEYSAIAGNIVLLVLALFIAYGRWVLAPL